MKQLNLILFILTTITLKGGHLADINSLECDFTSDLCTWIDPTSVVWGIGNYEHSTFGQPVKEVSDGGFINVQVPYTNEYLLESVILDERIEPFCLYFNYYMFGPVTGSLTLQAVKTEMDGGKSIKIQESIWKREGSQYDDWILGKYHVIPPKGKGQFILQFVATSEDIALGPIRARTGSCNYNNDCDFEDPLLCFWTVEPDYRSNFRWFVSNGSESAKDLVGTDVTTQTGVGHFMRTPKVGMIKSSSSLDPTIYLIPNEAKCLSFYFFKSSENSDNLAVDLKTTTTSTYLIWYSYRVTITGEWVPIEINLESKEDDDYLKLSLVASRDTKDATPIAIDEIKISPEPCTPTGSCNFNKGLCNYKTSSSQLLVGFGRVNDFLALGWDPVKNVDPYDLFVYTNTPKTEEFIEYTLESPTLFLDEKTCLTFSYALSFSSQASFSIYLIPVETKIPINIWTLNNLESTKSWTTIELTTPITDYTKRPFTLNFKFSGVRLFMGIDDILFHSCSKGGEDRPSKSCTYNGLVDNSCVDIVPSSFNKWQFTDTSLLRQSIPSIIHDDDDKVLAFDLSIPSRIDSMSFFYISNLKIYTPYCLKFWYIVDMDMVLNLWIDDLGNDFDKFKIIKPWQSLNNHFGLNWDQAKFQVEGVGPETMIIFAAVYKSNALGTIVIDGLELIEGDCSLDYEFFCDFEDKCIWNNLDSKLAVTGMGKVYEAKTKWIEVSAKGRLPSRDSSLKTINGHYLILESSKGEEAIFTFPPLYLADNMSELCLTLFVNPVAMTTLDILIEQSGIITLVDSLVVQKGYQWLPFDVLLKFNPKLSKVVHVYLSASGSLAIDDLRIKMGSCSSKSFKCDDGKMILASEVCDHKVDCSKGEDESKCGDCDFSENFCGYEADDEVNWSVYGGLVVAESKFGGLWGSKTSGLTSPTLRPTSPTCKVQINYKDRNPEVNQLKVLLLFQDGRDVEIWDDNMINTLENDLIQINLGRIPIPFSIQFYVQMNIVFWDRKPLSFGAIKMMDCGFEDTNDKQSTEAHNCQNGKKINLDQVCDSSFDCFDGDDEIGCDHVKTYSFEDKEAPLYWIDLKNDRVKWSYEKAEGSISSKPARDHSRGLPGSAYMAIYPVKDLISSLAESKEIGLVGPELSNIDDCSMVFYYNTAGVSLVVSILNDTTTRDLMTIPTDSHFGFKRQRVTLREGDIQGRFNFLLKAKYSQEDMGSYNKPYYAVIDDIVIDSKCYGDSNEPIDPTSKCSGDEFHCKKDNTCIPRDNVCNYLNDCSDGADEVNCGDCEFNGYTCGWTNEGEDYWVLPGDYELGPEDIKVPVMGLPKNFIIPDRRTSTVQSILKSPRLGSTSPVCVFSFTYFIRPYATMTIRVRNEQGSTRIFDVLLSENSWSEQKYKLESLPPGYYIQFVLEVTSTDLQKDLSPGGLAYFKFTDCNPAWDPSWITSTQPTIPTESPTTTPPPTVPPTSPPTTHKVTQPPPTIPTTKQVPTTLKPVTEPATIKPDPTPHHEINPDPVTISPSPIIYDNPKSDGVHLGAVPITLMVIGSVVLVSVLTAILAKKRIFEGSQSPNGVIPLLETNFRMEEAIGNEDGISFRNLQQSEQNPE